MTEPPQNTQADLLKVAKDLTESLEGVRSELAEVRKSARANRALIAGLAISLILDVTLTVLVSFFAVSLHTANNSTAAEAKTTAALVTQLYKTQVSSCQDGNITRAATVKTWQHLFNLSVTSSTPPSQVRQDQQLLNYIKTTFAPRDCATIYRH